VTWGNDRRLFDEITGKGIDAWAEEVPDATNLYQKRLAVDAADEVLVVGPPPVQTIRVDYLEFVLPVDVPGFGGLPGTRKILPITPDLIDQLVPKVGQVAAAAAVPAPGSGRVVPRTPTIDPFSKQPIQDAQRKAAEDAAAAAAVAASGSAAVQSALGQTSATLDQLRATLLFKAPFLGADWPDAINALVPSDVLQLLTTRLWKWVRLPAEFERYGRILDRAEAKDGKRLPAFVEAFTFRVVDVELTKEEAEGLSPDERTLLEQQYQDVVARLREVKKRIEGLSLKADQLARAVQQAITAAERTLDASGLTDPLTVAALAGNAGNPIALLDTLAKLGDAWASEGAPALAPDSSPDFWELAGQLSERWPQLAAALLKLPNATDFDPVARELGQLRADEKALEAEQLKIAEKIDPANAAVLKYAAAKKKFEASIRASGGASLDGSALATMQAAAVEAAAARTATPRITKKRQTVKRIVPLPRQRVRATIHVDEGLIELEEAAVWPHDLSSCDPRECYAVPLPVAITFGTWNLPEPSVAHQAPLPTGHVTRQAILQTSIDTFVASPSLSSYARDWGHILPAAPGSGGPLRLAFTRGDRKSGKAPVGPWPFRIASASERLQVLLPLRSFTGRPDNRADVLAVAAELAEAAMLEQVRESGTITVLGPRPVNCDGRISAVRWASDDAGNVDTVISLDPDAEPLPGLTVEQLERDPTEPLVFGIDLEDLK
jgi:hypothetical protein